MAPRAPEPSGHRDACFGWAEAEGQVLLVSNPRVMEGAWQDVWDLPGGAARGGESLAEALRREWREETGLEAVVGELLLVTDGSKRQAERGLLYTWRAYVFRVQSAGVPTPGAGIQAATWVPRAEVEARLAAPYHARVRAWLRGPEPLYGTLDWTEPAPTES
ncbi:MAG: NUDIX hydrolase, partial [Planctomycetota bacterium]|nr:NUDIX hydrolase [Planctomycetota bacterium]